MKKVTRAHYEEFLVRMYFGSNKPYIELCIDRAYRDFNRTLHTITKIEPTKKTEIYLAARANVQDHLERLSQSLIMNQEEFDKWHYNACLAIRKSYYEYGFSLFTLGQAQKWINMSLKYIFTLGETRISGFDAVYSFAHVPVDNIIIEQLRTYGMPVFFQCAWSRLDDYDSYLHFQKWVRNQWKEESPLDQEFFLWLN